MWSWLYTKEDNYKGYHDGTLVQSGSVDCTLGGGDAAQPLDMCFLSWRVCRFAALR